MYVVEKVASAPNSRKQCEDIMETIRTENPAWWPHGLSVAHHDELFLIRSASDRKPIGFTGWQTVPDRDGKLIGYYSIGILPEFRNQGFAKEAVSKIISMKSEGVDEVRAFIVPGNSPSVALAHRLNVPVVDKVASTKLAVNWKLMAPLLGGVGNAALWDAYANRHDYTSKDDLFGRLTMGLMNAGLGAGGGKLMQRGKHVEGAGMMALSPVKDLALSALPSMPKLPKALDAITQAQQAIANPLPTHETVPVEQPMWQKILPWAAGGALGLGGVLALNRLAGKVGDMNDQHARGKVTLRLPTKAPGDQETSVELPIQELGLSGKLIGNIGRDTRRKLRQEAKERQWHRRNHRLTTKAEPIDEELEKAAAWLALYKDATMLRSQPLNALSPKGGNGPIRGGFQSTINTDSGGASDGTIEGMAQLQKQQQQQAQKQLTESQRELKQHQSTAQSAQESVQDLKSQLAQSQLESKQHKALVELMKEKTKHMVDLYGHYSKLQGASNKGDADWHPVIKHVAARAEEAGNKIRGLMSKIAEADPMIMLRMCATYKKKASLKSAVKMPSLGSIGKGTAALGAVGAGAGFLGGSAPHGENPHEGGTNWSPGIGPSPSAGQSTNNSFDDMRENHPLLNTAAYFVPGVGTGLMAYDAAKDFREGNYLSGAASVVGAGLSLIPGVGGFLGKGVQRLGRWGSKLFGRTPRQVGRIWGAAGKPGARAISTGLGVGQVATGVAGQMGQAALNAAGQPTHFTSDSGSPSPAPQQAEAPAPAPQDAGATQRGMDTYGQNGSMHLANRYLPMQAFRAPYDQRMQAWMRPQSGLWNTGVNTAMNYLGLRNPSPTLGFENYTRSPGGIGNGMGTAPMSPIQQALMGLMQTGGQPYMPATSSSIWG